MTIKQLLRALIESINTNTSAIIQQTAAISLLIKSQQNTNDILLEILKRDVMSGAPLNKENTNG